MSEQRSSSRSPVAVIVVVVLFAVVAAVFISTGTMHGRGAKDDERYHSVAITDFVRHWPALDFSDYQSATTPGYHVVLATAGQLTDARWWLRCVGAVFTIGLLGTITWWLSRRMGQVGALVCALPILCSMYVLDSGVYLLPDNAGWWGVCLILLLALRERFGAREIALGGLVLFLLVWFRQSHVWSAALIWTAAWLGGTRRDENETLLMGVPFDEARIRATRVSMAFMATVPALVVLVSFYILWGNRLSPPSFAELHTEGLQPAAPAFFLSIFGIASVGFASWWWPGVRVALCDQRGRIVCLLIAGGVCGLMLALLPETTLDAEAGRFSGLWRVADRLPIVMERTSLLIAALSALGGALLVAWCYAIDLKPRWVLLAGVLSFVAAQCANPQVWQRYHEPFVLILMAVLASQVRSQSPTPLERTARCIGPIALAGGLAAISIVKVITSPSVGG